MRQTNVLFLSNTSTTSGNKTYSRTETKTVLKYLPKILKQSDIKTQNIEKIIKVLKPAEEYLNTENENLQMDFRSTVEFVIETYGSSDIKNIASKYTNNHTGPCDCLTKIYSLINNRHMKSRITKIKRRLVDIENNMNISDNNSESVSEIEDQEVFYSW